MKIKIYLREMENKNIFDIHEDKNIFERYGEQKYI